ncbi:MAG TPA: hypothetical protein VK607_10665 [Kofleriaceae bacterium]|nr:hypothetical protein [Kofleriaceae bacterium]
MASVIVTSDYSNLSSGAITGRLGRTSATTGERGRARMSIQIESEPLVHVFDEVQLGHGPAQAAAGALAEKVRRISSTVSESTQLTRSYQEQAYAAGKRWARSRFGGPRMGERPPRDGELRKFNHSGTTADSIVGTENKTERAWTVNVAANRLDPRTSRTPHEFAFITDALRAEVPEMDNPHRLAELPEVRAAVAASIDSLIMKAAALNDKLRAQRLSSVLSLFRLDGLVGGVQKILML